MWREAAKPALETTMVQPVKMILSANSMFWGLGQYPLRVVPQKRSDMTFKLEERDTLGYISKVGRRRTEVVEDDGHRPASPAALGLRNASSKNLPPATTSPRA